MGIPGMCGADAVNEIARTVVRFKLYEYTQDHQDNNERGVLLTDLNSTLETLPSTLNPAQFETAALTSRSRQQLINTGATTVNSTSLDLCTEPGFMVFLELFRDTLNSVSSELSTQGAWPFMHSFLTGNPLCDELDSRIATTPIPSSIAIHQVSMTTAIRALAEIGVIEAQTIPLINIFVDWAIFRPFLKLARTAFTSQLNIDFELFDNGVHANEDNPTQVNTPIAFASSLIRAIDTTVGLESFVTRLSQSWDEPMIRDFICVLKQSDQEDRLSPTEPILVILLRSAVLHRGTDIINNLIDSVKGTSETVLSYRMNTTTRFYRSVESIKP
jgi:hypothetical protein